MWFDFCLYSWQLNFQQLRSKPGQWGKNVGWRGPKRPTKTRNPLPMLSAGAPNSGVLCGCSTFLSITQTLHLLIHSLSLPPSLIPHSFHLDLIWFKYLNIISICCLSGSGPESGRGPGPKSLRHRWVHFLTSLVEIYISLLLQLFWEPELNQVNSQFWETHRDPRWKWYICSLKQHHITSGGVGINKARYKDLTGIHWNEERNASPSQVHLP